MNESTINPLNLLKMEISHECDNNAMGVNKQHSEGDANASTVSGVTASIATASPAKQTVKRQLTPEFSVGGHQTACFASSGASAKKPRLDLADRKAASDPQGPPPTSIMSSSQHPMSLYPLGHLDEEIKPNTLPSLGENYERGLILGKPRLPPPSQLSLFNQPWSPRSHPRAIQTSTAFNHHGSGPIPVKETPYYDEKPDMPLCRLDFGAAAVRSAPAFPLQAIPPFETSQQMRSFADPEAHIHQPQQSTTQHALDGSLGAQISDSPQDSHAVTEYTPSANNIEKQTRQFGSTSLTFSKPAHSDDLDPFSKQQRRLIMDYTKTKKGKDDKFFMQWYSEIRRPFWAQILVSFGERVPASMSQQVLDELCASHPCIIDPWSGHALYRELLGSSQSRMKPISVLQSWMYGAGATTHATWRDTLRTKVGQDKKVPWVKRAKIIALYVILACAEAGWREKASASKAAQNVRSKREILAACKLNYLLSDQGHVITDEYWDGFAEELENDPEQEHLYDKVMQMNQSGPPENTASWPPSLPTHGQEPQVWGEQDHRRSGGQGSLSGTGWWKTIANTGENISQNLGNHEPAGVAQLSCLPMEEPHQETEHIQSPATQETSLQDRVQQLEGQVTELRWYIGLMHQQLPGFIARPPWASSQHQP